MPFLAASTLSQRQTENSFDQTARPFRGQTDHSPDVRDSVCSRDSVRGLNGCSWLKSTTLVKPSHRSLRLARLSELLCLS